MANDISIEARAVFAIQSALYIPQASSNILLTAIDVLSPTEYIEVVEERSTDGYCGYPMCDNTARGNKSRLLNALTDDEWGRYCSQDCYHASS